MDSSTEEYYSRLDQRLRRFKGMNLARWKLIQNTLISGLVVVLALETNADATVAIAVLALINGISFADLASIWGVSVELRGEGPPVSVERETQLDASEKRNETETKK